MKRLYTKSVILTGIIAALCLGVGLFLQQTGESTAQFGTSERVQYCGTGHRGTFTGLDGVQLCNTNALLVTDRTGTDFTGDDGAWNWQCENTGATVTNSCFAYKVFEDTRRLITEGADPIGIGQRFLLVRDILLKSDAESETEGEAVPLTIRSNMVIGGDTYPATLNVLANEIEVVGGSTAWDGNLFAPAVITDGSTIAAAQTAASLHHMVSPIAMISAGSPTSALRATDGRFAVRVFIGLADAGKMMKVLRSDLGGPRVKSTPRDGFIVGLDGFIDIRTDRLSNFTVGPTSGNRNNMNYINQSFRNLDPYKSDIIAALYGTGSTPGSSSGTAYTQNRSGRDGSQCNLTGMQVEYVPGGTGTIPLQLSGNTIYVLTGNSYTTTGTVNFSGCSAIIGQTGNIIQISGSLGFVTPILQMTKNHQILDNIRIRGTNIAGLTIGIYISGGQNSTIHKAEVYDFYLGMYINNAKYNSISFLKSHNNSQGGININFSSQNNSINNALIFNNGYAGIDIEGNSTKNTINNSHITNSSNYGIYISSDNNSINNLLIENNSTKGLLVSGINNTYYGNNFLVNNSDNSVTNIIQGTGLLMGNITTGSTISRNYLINPHNSISYLLSRYTGFNTIIGQQTWTATNNISYSIGGYTPLQIQPVRRNLAITGLEYYGTTGQDRNTGHFIGSDITALSGSLTRNLGAYTTSTGATIIFTSPTQVNYTLTGNFVGSPKTGTINGTINTGITFTGGEGYKVVILQLSTGDNRATHYGLTTTLDTTFPSFTGTAASIGSFTSGQYLSTTGISISYSDTNISGATLDGNVYTGTRITSEALYIFRVTDLAGNSTGITFTIDKTAPTIAGASGGNTYTTTSLTLTRNDTNLSGFTISKNGYAYYTSFTNGSLALTGEGTYVLTGTDKANNITGFSFTLVTPFTATLSLTGIGTTMIANGSAYYTKSQGAFEFQTNKNASCQFSGAFTTSPYTISTTAGQKQTFYPYLTSTDGTKGIYMDCTAGSQTGSDFEIIALDTTGPNITLTYPNDTQSGLSGTVNMGRGGVDSGVGMSGYQYFISTTGTFATYVTSGRTTSSSVNIPYETFLTSGTYYRKVKGYDKFNRSGTSDPRSFEYIATVDAQPDDFSFDRVNDADLDETYTSESITITGITANVQVLATIDNGILYISGHIVGQTGYVKKGDTVKIELMSSDDYDETVISELTIGSQSAEFKVTTKSEGDENEIELTAITKLHIAEVFNTITDLYEDNKSKQLEFIITFKSMLNDAIDTLEDDNNLNSSEERKLAILNYLLDLTQDFIDDNDISDDDIHTAPNGKRYFITYDDSEACYSSPNFIDPGSRCFSSLESIKSYIDSNNQKRDHTIDTSRTMAPYAAPSGKVYTIQRTTDGRYYSYRFIAPKYFNTLADIKWYIDKRNPACKTCKK